jgi:hypothetical protein
MRQNMHLAGNLVMIKMDYESRIGNLGLLIKDYKKTITNLGLLKNLLPI